MLCSRVVTSIVLAFFLFAVGGCVSVNIKQETPEKATDYQFQAPQTPYLLIKNDQMDHVWQNKKNGNTISVLSECSKSKDPSLKTVESDLLNALNEAQILETKAVTFNDREALRSLSEGTVDGILVKLSTLIFKKNSCLYTLTHIGRSKDFSTDQSVFQKFTEEFVVP